jgi:hypothetical protein
MRLFRKEFPKDVAEMTAMEKGRGDWQHRGVPEESKRPADDLNFGIVHGNLYAHKWLLHKNEENEYSIDAFSWRNARLGWFYMDIGIMCHWMQCYLRDLYFKKNPKNPGKVEESLKLEIQMQDIFCEAYEQQT